MEAKHINLQEWESFYHKTDGSVILKLNKARHWDLKK